MTFAATKVADLSLGNKRGELWSFTQAGADTGGTFTTGLKVEGIFPCVATAVAVGSSVSGQTVTLVNVAGPTSGFVLIIGY